MRTRRPQPWDATGLVEKAWNRLDPPTRDHLAALLKLSAGTNLSKMNTGEMLMTLAYAERIADVVPKLTVADLGAPSSVVAEVDPTVVELLESLADDLAEAVRKQATTTRRLQARLRRLEAHAWPDEAQSMGP